MSVKRPLYRLVTDGAMPGLPFTPAEALASAAVELHAPAALMRGGPFGRASRLVERGVLAPAAAFEAAKQGKGHVGELAQSVTQTVLAAVLDHEHVAAMNSVANDPLVDVEILRGHVRAAGYQVKVGSPAYVARSLKRRAYGSVVVNEEAIEAARRADLDGAVVELADRLSFEGVDSEVLRADECTDRATRALERMLLGEVAVGSLEVVTASVLAGGKDGVVSLVLELAASFGHSLFTGEPFDLEMAIRNALARAGKAAARTTLQTHLLLTRFLSEAGAEYSAHVLRRIAGQTVVLGAVAQVGVETAIDLCSVLRGRMSFEHLLRRFGVHALSAGGGAVGVIAAMTVTRGAPWWVTLLAALGAGYVGARLGGVIGEGLFLATGDVGDLAALEGDKVLTP